jgi:signal transduction histidine kinase
MLIVLAVMLAVEVAIVVPVTVTRHWTDQTRLRTQLQSVADQFGKRAQLSLAGFAYHVRRTASTIAILPDSAQNFVSQSQLDSMLRLEDSPHAITDGYQFIWAPIVPSAGRANFEANYGLSIKQFDATGRMYVSANNRSFYVPLTLFSPRLIEKLRFVAGFDSLTNAAPGSETLLFPNFSYSVLVTHTWMPLQQPNNFGIGVVESTGLALENPRNGFVFGIVSAADLLANAMPFLLRRDEVTLAMFSWNATGPDQLMFYDTNSTFWTSLTTIDAFMSRQDLVDAFYFVNFTYRNMTFLISIHFHEAYTSAYMYDTWAHFLGILVPICFFVDVVFIVFYLLWTNHLEKQKAETEKRKMSQMIVSYVNHEIRNPLQAIMGLADLTLEDLEEIPGTAHLVSNLHTVIRSAEFIEHIANDILDLRRIEEGKIQVSLEAVDVRQLISQMRLSTKSLQDGKPEIHFEARVPLDAMLVHTDRYRIEQIVMNFLTNAFKYTDHGEVTLSLLRRDDGYVRVSVTDTGRGITTEQAKYIFAPFSQVSANDQAVGFGLGLYLTKMMADVLGARVGFRSEVGVGSEFWVDVPLSNDDMEMADKAIEDQFESSESSMNGDKKRRRRRRRVFCIK